MRRGVAPSLFPTAGTTFPLDTLLFNASLFPFPAAWLIHSLRHATRATSLIEGGYIARQPANLLSCPGRFVAGVTQNYMRS